MLDGYSISSESSSVKSTDDANDSVSMHEHEEKSIENRFLAHESIKDVPLALSVCLYIIWSICLVSCQKIE